MKATPEQIAELERLLADCYEKHMKLEAEIERMRPVVEAAKRAAAYPDMNKDMLAKIIRDYEAG
jgi:predicted RecB family endonuclease